MLYVKFLNKLVEVGSTKVDKKIQPFRDELVGWASLWIFKEDEMDYLSSSIAQSILSKSLDPTEEMVENLVKWEIDSWKNKKNKEINLVYNALNSALGWIGETNKEKRAAKIKEWMTSEFGFQWWLLMDILADKRMSVLVAAISTGHIEKSWLDQVAIDFNFAKKKHITYKYAKDWSHQDGVDWPQEWRGAWESGKLKKECKAQVSDVVGSL